MTIDPTKNWQIFPDGTITWLGKPVTTVPDQAGNSFYEFIEALKEAEREEVIDLQTEVNRLENEVASLEVECIDLQDEVDDLRGELGNLRNLLGNVRNTLKLLLEESLSEAMRRRVEGDLEEIRYFMGDWR